MQDFLEASTTETFFSRKRPFRPVLIEEIKAESESDEQLWSLRLSESQLRVE